MTTCTILQALMGVVVIAGVFAWLVAAVTYIALLRDYDGPKSKLVLGSLWMLRANSLGPKVEPRRRLLGRVFVVFAALVVLAAVLAIFATGSACQ